MIRVVALRELEDRLVRLLGQPDDGANRQLRRPLDFIDEPRRGNARELGAGRAVDVERGIWMALQERCSHLDVDVALDGAPDDAGLVLACGENGDLSRIDDGRDAHRDRFARHELFPEEISCRVATRDRVERHDSRSTIRAGAWLVEPNVPRLADAEDLEVDPAGAVDRVLITTT